MIPSGYKQTDIGLIPEDWEIKQIGEFTDAIAGGTPNTTIPEYWGGDIPWMSSGELNKRRVHSVDGRITKTGLENSSTHMIPENCVLVGLAGQGKTRGTVAINYISLCTNQSIAAIFPNDQVETEYLYQNLYSRYDELRELSSGDGGRGGLNLKLIKNLIVPIPPLPEQRRIAEALSDVDELIASLEKLIEKKKALKQGVMQELLTGKRRLPGFTGEWITSNQLFEVVKGEQINGSELQEDLPYPLYNGGVSASGYTSDYNYENRVIISEGGNSCGYINYIKTKFWAGGHCYVVINAKVLNDYLYQLLKLHETNIMALRVGSGLPNIQKEELKKLRFSYPKGTEEQRAIVKVLYDIDLGIRRLTDKLDKVHKIKSGMMSELLAGRIRFV